MGLSFPLSQLTAELSLTEGFSAGAAHLAAFFRTYEENADPGELLLKLLNECDDKELLEYALFSLMDLGIADIDVARQALQLRRLHRVLSRYCEGSNLTDGEIALCQECMEELATPPESIPAARPALEKLIDHLFSGFEVSDEERGGLAFLIRHEATAMKERIAAISANVDPYNMRIMARVLPRLSIYDERVKAQLDLAEAIQTRQPVGARVLTFAYRLRTDGYHKWHSRVSGHPELGMLLSLLDDQQQKLVPTLSLVALATLARWAEQARGTRPSVQSWIRTALDSYKNGTFSIDIGDALERGRDLISKAGCCIKGSVVHGELTERTVTTLVGDNLLTRSLLQGKERVTVKQMVAACMRNDSLMLRLLSNPKVYGTSGVVEKIVRQSRSLLILSTIARDPSLHAGQANTGVVYELLRNPVAIPLTLIRPLINVRYVRLSDLRSLVRNGSSYRRDVVAEVEEYLRRRG